MREHVRRGLGTEVLQRAYRTAQAALSHLLLNRLRVLTDDPDDLATLAGDFNDFLFAWVEELERQILAVYLREREDWLRGATAQRAALVRTILDGARIDVTATSRRLEYELERPHVGYVIWAPDDESEAPTTEMRRMAAAVAEALLARDSLIVELGPHLACWSTAGSRPAPARFSGLPRFAGLSATVGTPARGVNGFRLSHQEALMARRVARLAGSSDALTTYSDVALESLTLHDVDEARRFVERELGPLVADDAAARRMGATIRVFLEESSSFRGGTPAGRAREHRGVPSPACGGAHGPTARGQTPRGGHGAEAGGSAQKSLTQAAGPPRFSAAGSGSQLEWTCKNSRRST